MKLEYKTLLIVGLFFSISVLSMIRLNTFQLVDFEVYYKAGERVYQGITPYQHVEDGHFIYKYSPVFALAMIPFSWVNYTIAKWIYLFLLFICFYSSCTILLKEVEAKKTGSL